MPETALLITIDTEGDDIWARPRQVTTRNAQFLPRFQALCDRFRLKPTYLVNYEMAMSDEFVEFARDRLTHGACEVGMHLHAWNSPPLHALTVDDMRHQPYLVEYPEPVMRAKIETLTALLAQRFGQAPVSHRAGRWALDGRYAALLIEQGYRVDCSVTPGVDWRAHRGAPHGSGGSDYTAFPLQPYFIDPADPSLPAAGALLEVPVTIHTGFLYRLAPWMYRVPLLRRIANRISRRISWMCPAESSHDAMRSIADAAWSEEPAHLQFTLHSSELMPGGSPSFRSAQAIEQLYEDLEILFADLSTWCRGMTLKEFHARHTAGA